MDIALKVLLVRAPSLEAEKDLIMMPPLGLAYLAAVCRANHEVSILDAFAEGLTHGEFAERVSRDEWDVIGLTAVTPMFEATRRAIRVCRAHARVLVLGGPHATVFRDALLKDNPELDYVMLGECEQTFPKLLEALESGGRVDAVPGLVSREHVGSAPRSRGSLDAIPFPARDLLPNSRYRYPLWGNVTLTSIITSRGCPYSCIFCDKSISGKTWRARSPENVLAEVDEVVRKYGARYIVFYDDLFMRDKQRVAAICEGLIERNYHVRWKAEGRVDLVDEKLLSLMRRAGCDILAYGVESANQASLDYLRKGTSPDMAREAFRKTRAAGIKTMGYFILGIPVESYERALNTIRFATEIKADYAQFSVLSPFPGTRLYEEVMKKGWYRETSTEHVAGKGRLWPVVISDLWDEDKLVRVVREAHRQFYLRPGYVLKSLLSVRSLSEAGELAKLGLGVAKYIFCPE